MSKNGLFLTSLVAAIPGAVLACLMVMAFVNYAGGPTWWVKILAGMLLLIGALLAAMPVAIILFAGPKAEKVPKREEAAEKPESVEAESEAAGESARSGATDSSLEVVEADESGMTRQFDVDEDAGGEDFDLGPGSEFEMEAAEADVEAEDEGPKKGKK